VTFLKSKMVEQTGSKTLDFLSSARYVIAFSVLYSLIIGLLFYPGLVYTDSIFRWQTAINVADHGLSALSGNLDHHPIFPILWMAFFYKMTGEIGLFTIFQAILFSLSFFFLVRHFSPNLAGNAVASLMLLAPVNEIYSVFVSYDTLFAIQLAFLFLLLLNRWKLRIFLIPMVVAAAIGTRLNAALIIPAVFLILFLQRNEFKRGQLFLTTSLCLILTAFVLSLPVMLGMTRGNSFLIGTAWEYANMATKTNDKRDIEFLNSFGASVDDLKEGICYHGIWCGREWDVFISKVPSWRGRELLERYVSIAVDHPAVFFPEKLKYIRSVMGIGGDGIKNEEIGRWREPKWAALMKTIGFETSPKKENFINRYFRFSEFSGKILFRPWLVFLLMAAMAFHLAKREKYLVPLTMIPAIYYGSFFLTSQNHEFRYFFPVAFLFLAYFCACVSIWISHPVQLLRSVGRQYIP